MNSETRTAQTPGCLEVRTASDGSGSAPLRPRSTVLHWICPDGFEEIGTAEKTIKINEY